MVNYKLVSGSQTIEQGCLATTDAGYDANCDKYIYDATPANVVCDTCKTKFYKLAGVNGPGASDLWNYCFKYNIEGCTTYATTSTTRTLAMAAADVTCSACANTYTLIQTDTATIYNVPSTAIGYCGLTNRWINEPLLCLKYAKPDLDNVLSLTCASCQAASNGVAPSCYLGDTKTGTCTSG